MPIARVCNSLELWACSWRGYGVGFVAFVDKFGGAGAPFFWRVAVSSYESEQEVEEVMC